MDGHPYHDGTQWVYPMAFGFVSREEAIESTQYWSGRKMPEVRKSDMRKLTSDEIDAMRLIIE
jgi:hypothetical protein